MSLALFATLTFSVWYLNPFDGNSGLTLEEQRAKYQGSSVEEINSLPKYDRPDLAVMQNFDMTRDPSTNEVPVERALQAFGQVKKDLQAKAIPGVSWTERGPDNVGGRTRAIMFDPNDGTSRTVWAGGVGGGLWFNTDITSSSTVWQNVDDFWANIAVTTIAFDPSNTQTFYVGTGEGFFNADAIRGAGIWKSTNGGTGWTQLSSTTGSDFHYVQKVVVTPSGTVIAATRAGLFRSTNGGSSWTSLFAGAFADIEVASNGDVWASEGIFSTGVVRKSTNDGVSWTTVTPATGAERIELAIAPSDPNTVYAVASNNTAIAWMYRTDNAGASWNAITVPQYTEQSCSLSGTNDFARGQAWYDLIMSVSPTNPNIALVGGIDIYKTTNSGSSWGLVSYWTGACDTYVHADQHAMVWSPTDTDAAIFGNDGGVFYSSNVGSASNPSFVARNNGYNVTQFYAGDQWNTSGSNVMLAGAQDNGSHRYSTAGINSTTEVTGGDGAFCHIDQANGNYQITSYVYNSFYRSTNGGGSFSSILQNQTYGRFINPTEYDDNAKVLYSAANEDQYIYLDNLTGSAAGVGAFLNTVSLGNRRASAFKASPYTANRVFLATGTNRGTGGSAVYRIDNANTGSPTATLISTAAIPSDGYISSIDVGSSENQLLITYANYGLTSVWETRNGGSTWTNREGNLPDMPIRWGLYNPNNTDEVLLATELGVWSTDNISLASPDWGATSLGLANVRCDMLQYRDSDGQVMVATHGRGSYTGFPFSGAAPDTQAPTTPTNLTSSNVTDTGFDVSWTASTDNIGVTGYNVYLNGSLDGSTASTSYSFAGLSASTSYNVAVEATDAAGNLSGQLTGSVSTTAPGAISCTSTVSGFPYGEGFESGDGWTQLGGDDGDWVRTSASTPSSGTGPTSAAEGSFYLFLEASTNSSPGQIGSNATAILESPCFDLSGETAASFSFQYHLYGTNVGTLTVSATTDDVSYATLWTLSGDQGNAWGSANVDLASYLGSTVKLRITGTTGNGWSSDIAVDDLGLSTGGTPGDTQAPTTPTGVAASSIAETSFTVNWNASTDNVGVTGYNVYLDGNLLGSVTGTGANVTGLVASTTYAVAVEATDAAGNLSGQASINVTTADATGGCTSATVNSEGFESNWGIWNDGGSDARRSINDAAYANTGSYCVRLRDNTSTSTMTTDNIDLSTFDDLTVDFAYFPRSMETNEDFWLQISTNGGSTYATVETWAAGTDFVNNNFYTESVTITGPFTTNTRVRFRCDASGNSDYVYIDDVVISGCNTTGTTIIHNGGNDIAGVANPFDEVDDFDLEEVVVYPNPVQNLLQIKNLPEAAAIRLMDVTGRVLIQSAQEAALDVSHLTPGMYFLRIVVGDESRTIKIKKN